MDCVCDGGARGAISERVVNACSGSVDFGVVEEDRDLEADAFRVGSDEDGRTRFDRFLAFGLVAHDEDGLAERGGFFLDAA